MSKKLITEILRQHELMGVKQILSEGEGLEFFKKMFRLTQLEPTLKNAVEDAFEDIKVSDPDLIKKFQTNFGVSDFNIDSLSKIKSLKFINSSVLINILDELETKITKTILTSEDVNLFKLADEIINDILLEKPNSKKIYEYLLNAIENNQIDEFERGLKQYGQYFPEDVITHLRNKIKNIDPPSPEPGYLENMWKSIEDKFGNAWVLTVKGWDEIKTWPGYLAELLKANSILEGVFTSQPISPIAKMMHLSYDKIMLEPFKIKQKMDEVFNEIVDKFERGVDTDVTKEQNQLTALFSQFLSKRNESHKMIYNTWMQEWKTDPRIKRLFNQKRIIETGEIRNGKPITKEIPEPFYFKETFNDPKFLEMMDKFETAKGTNISQIKQTYSKYEGSIQFIKNTFGLLKVFNRPTNKAAWVRYAINMGDFFQRLIGIVSVWTPNTFRELKHNQRVLGTKRWIGLGIGQKLVTSLVWVPTLLATYRTIGSAIQDWVNSDRQANAKPGQELVLMDWWLLDDTEWSKIMDKDKDKGGLNSYLKALGFFGSSWKKLNGANFKELGTAPAAWSLAAWAYLENPNFDFSPKDFKKQMDSVEVNSKNTLDTLNKDKNVQNLINQHNLPTYDTLSTNINDTLKNKPKLVASEEANY